MALSYAQLEGVWLQAAAGTKYATQTWAALMAAIAMAESSGRPDAVNAADNGGTQSSWGLWQISLGNHSAPSPTWNNPITNAQLAIGKLNSQGLAAWGTYTTGAYKAFLNSSTTPDTSGLGAGAVGGAAAGGLSTASAGTDAVTAAQLTAAGDAANNCAWGISFGWGSGAGFLGGIISALGGLAGISGLTSGQVCLVSKPQVRALMGAGVIIAGGVITLGGVSLVAAAAALPAAERIAGGIIGGRAVGLFTRAGAAVGGSESEAAPAPPPPVYQGNSPSGSTPPPVTIVNRPPTRTSGPSARTAKPRTGGRTQQGSRKAS